MSLLEFLFGREEPKKVYYVDGRPPQVRRADDDVLRYGFEEAYWRNLVLLGEPFRGEDGRLLFYAGSWLGQLQQVPIGKTTERGPRYMTKQGIVGERSPKVIDKFEWRPCPTHIYDPQEKTYTDTRTGEVRILNDGLLRLDATQRLVKAGGWPPPKVITQTEVGQVMAEAWQAIHRVPLLDCLPGSGPSIHSLVLGMTVDDAGKGRLVTGDMSNMVHVQIGGASGWGKSVFLQALAYQLARSREPVGLALLDLEGVTFSPFQKCEALLYPVADTEADANAILTELADELDRRKALYSQHVGVDSLGRYNDIADESLTPIVVLVDEAMSLLADTSVEAGIRKLTLRGRKYGLWLALASQMWRVVDLNKAIRSQLSAKVAFHCDSQSDSRLILGDVGAEELDVPGRCLIRLPGQAITMAQAPIIGHSDMLQLLSGRGPQRALPAPMEDTDGLQVKAQELWEDGASLNEIAKSLFGYSNGRLTGQVKVMLGLT